MMDMIHPLMSLQLILFPHSSPTERPSRVGGRRGTIAGPFPTSPLRTRRDRFLVTSLSSGQSCRLSASSDVQLHFGSPHFAYRMVADRLSTCAPSPCRRPSRPPWWLVNSTT